MSEEERIPRSSSLSHDVAPRYTSSSASSSSLLLSNPQPIDESDEQQYQHFTGGGRGGGDDGLTMMMMDDNRDDDDDETNPNTDIDFDGEDGINGLTSEDMEDGTEPGSLGNNSSNNSLRKRRLMKKAPDAPKRFKSAYICFVTDKMDDVKKSLPADMKVKENTLWILDCLMNRILFDIGDRDYEDFSVYVEESSTIRTIRIWEDRWSR